MVQRRMVRGMLLCALLLCCIADSNEIWMSPIDIGPGCQQEGSSCGETSDCPCIGFTEAVDAGYSLHQLHTPNITIFALPGTYFDSSCYLNYSLSIISTQGEQKTTIDFKSAVSFTIFHIDNSTVTVQGFRIQNSTSRHPLIANLTNSANLQLIDIHVYNVFASLIELYSSFLRIQNCVFSLCANNLSLLGSDDDSTIEMLDSSVDSCSGINLIKQGNEEIRHAATSLTNVTLTNNSFEIGIITHTFNAINSAFFGSTQCLATAHAISLYNSSIDTETFYNHHYLSSNGTINITNTSFTNLVGSASFAILHADTYSILAPPSNFSNIEIYNCSISQVFFLSGIGASVDGVRMRDCDSDFGTFRSHLGGRTRMTLNDIGIERSGNINIIVPLDGEYAPSISITNIYLTQTRNVLQIFNLGGVVTISDAIFEDVSQAFSITGACSISNFLYSGGLPSGPPINLDNSVLTFHNITIENVVSKNPIMLAFDSLVSGSSLHFRNNTGLAILSITNTNSTFTDLTIESSNTEYAAIYIGNSHTTIEQGQFLHNNASRQGGALYSSNSEINLNYCTFRGNKAQYGGSLFLVDTVLYWSDSYCTNCVSLQDGGCLFTQNLVTGRITNVTFADNICLGSGGAICAQNLNSLDFVSCIISNNTALNGGGAYFSGTSLSFVDNSTVIDNKAISSGGGMLLKEQARTRITRTVISNNYAESTGGGIKVSDNAKPNLNEVFIINNSSPNEGGGISYSDSSIAQISNSFIMYNSVNSSGGGICFSISSHGTLTNVTIESNRAKSKGGGIAFYNNCHPILQEVLFRNNFAPEGGAVSSKDAANPQFISTTFSNNSATTNGGASIIYDSSKGSYTSCQFHNNTSDYGGAVAVNDLATTQFIECIFDLNSSIRGGAMSISSQRPVNIMACTFTSNRADYGGALLLTGASNYTSISDTNCLSNIAAFGGGCIQAEDGAIVSLYNCSLVHNIVIGRLGSGGALHCADRSIIYASESWFGNNTASKGGGLFVEQFATLQGDTLNIVGNIASDGAGLFCQGTLISFSDSHFLFNTASFRGGGMSMSTRSLFARSTSFCENSNFRGNSAVFGGGAYFAIESNAESVDDAFTNVNFSYNNAVRGGGAYFEHPNRYEIFQSITFYANTATHYGGGMFISRSRLDGKDEDWMVTSHFETNTAGLGGSNVGWTIFDKVINFCDSCDFGAPSASFEGYDNEFGWASPPSDLVFQQGCPSDVYLSGDPFNVDLLLVDSLHTPLTGSIVDILDAHFEVMSTGDCNVTSPDDIHILTQEGVIPFHGLSLSGYNNQTCSLTFYLTDTARPAELKFLQTITCDVVFNGCSKSEIVQISPDQFDVCVTNSEKEKNVNRALFLSIIIVVLLMFILCVVVCTIVWDRYRPRPKPFFYPAHAEDKEITLATLLYDSQIPTIPWNDIKCGMRIGFGSSGIVMDGHWQQDSTTLVEVALKEIICKGATYDSKQLSQLAVEIRLMCAIDNKHIILFHGISISKEEKLYLVSELMHKGNLRDLIDKKGSNLSWRMRLKFAISAAKGVSYLHENDIIHRDLKLQNLLVDDNWKCRVADLGVSTTKENLYQSLSIVGTPLYIAPEALNQGELSEKIDVYSFSILLYELYSGERPYSEFSHIPQAQLLFQIIAGVRPNTERIPSALKLLLEDCWNPEPKLRPSFLEIIVRLRRLNTLELPLPIVEDDQTIPLASIQAGFSDDEANICSSSLR